MKKAIIFMLVSLFCSSLLVAQKSSELVLNRGGLYKNDTLLTKNQTKMLLTKDATGAFEYNQAISNGNIASVFLISGGVVALGGCVVLLAQTASGSMSWAPVYISVAGLGIVLAGIPFTLKSGKHYKKSIDIYNSNIKSTGYNNDIRLNMNVGITQNGVGVVFEF